MVMRKAVVLGAIMAMSSAPAALAAPGNGHGNGNGNGPKEPNTNVPVKKGNPHNGGGQTPAQPAPKCTPHTVGYVASGTLVSDTLTEGSNHTYNGEVTVAVQHGNRQARSAVGSNVTFKVEGARLVLAVRDANGDGVVNTSDLAAGDRVHVLGRISALPKSCTTTETPQPVISKLAFHMPAHHGAPKPAPQA